MSSPQHSEMFTTGHEVQFYDDDKRLVQVVGRFLSDGVRAGQPIILIATAAHQRQFIAEMLKNGVDVEDLVVGRDVVILDAAETLAAFMEGNRPSAELFSATVGNVFEQLMSKRSYAVVRAYGEMVDLLWNDGKAEAAIALERLWNGLAKKYSFKLLCGYSEESMRHSPPGIDVRHICAEHSRVLPFERGQVAS
jgi:KaiC/GvpD/RAD55 family RecA-like ATPase